MELEICKVAIVTSCSRSEYIINGIHCKCCSIIFNLHVVAIKILIHSFTKIFRLNKDHNYLPQSFISDIKMFMTEICQIIKVQSSVVYNLERISLILQFSPWAGRQGVNKRIHFNTAADTTEYIKVLLLSHMEFSLSLACYCFCISTKMPTDVHIK